MLDTYDEAQRRAAASALDLDPKMQAFRRSAAIIDPLMGNAPTLPSLQSFIPDLRSPQQQLDATYQKIIANAKGLGQVREAATKYAEGLAHLNAIAATYTSGYRRG